MSTDAFTAADKTDSTTGDSLSTTEEFKYAQIQVPAFKYNETSSTSSNATSAVTTVKTVVGSDGTTTTTTSSGSISSTSGNSFLRLGSFPGYATAKKTVTSGSTTTVTNTTTVASDAPSGFINSVNLAKLVGDASSVAAAETTVDTEPSSVLEDASNYKGDANYLLGFADDTRYRKSTETTYIGGADVSNSTDNRKAETQKLLTKGGWWDHSDGNRVSTTVGDKVEVIQGNYKMVILGRQNPDSQEIGRTAITDFSGGHFQEQYTSPTPAIKTVEWRQSEGLWTLFQDNGSGNVTTKFTGKQVTLSYGEKRDEFAGSKLETIVGEDPAGGLDWLDIDRKTGANDPHITSKTWATKIETYTGAEGKPVTEIFTLTHAKVINNTTFCAEISNVTTSALNMDVADTAVKISMLIGGMVDLMIGPKLSVGIKRWQFEKWLDQVFAVRTETAAVATENFGVLNQNAVERVEITGGERSVRRENMEFSMEHMSYSQSRQELAGVEHRASLTGLFLE